MELREQDTGEVVMREKPWGWKGAGLLILGCAWFGLAADSGTGNKPKDKQVVDTKATKRQSAGAVNFKKELGLPYPSLGTLGSRIEAARRAPDPVALGHAASELHVAEKVSGKKASLTSQALLKEAAELASLRRQVSELQAVAQVSSQVAAEQSLVTNLQQQVQMAKKIDKEEKETIQRNENPTGAPRKLLVNNYSTQYFDIYVNGFMKMQVGPGQSKWCVIEHKWNPTVLKAYGTEDTNNWGPRYIWGRFKTYTWNLY
jgi:hypothetical protein